MFLVACASSDASVANSDIDRLIGREATVVIDQPNVPGLSEADVVWLFREEDCLSCQTFDYLLRRAHEERGDLRFVTLIRGDGIESASVFFRSRRLSTETYQLVGWNSFVRLPALIVIEDGRLAWIQDGEGRIAPEGVHLAEALGLRGPRSVAPDSGP